MTPEAIEEICDLWRIVVKATTALCVAFCVVFGAALGLVAGAKVLKAAFPKYAKPTPAVVSVATTWRADR